MKQIVEEFGLAIVQAIVGIAIIGLFAFAISSLSTYQVTAGVPGTAVAASRESTVKTLEKEVLLVETKKGIKTDCTYSVSDLVEPKTGQDVSVSGGKFLQEQLMYDGNGKDYAAEDLSQKDISSGGKYITFRKKGLYRICLSVRSSDSRNVLQYVYVGVSEA